jgi:hypothetical protein
MIIDTGFPFHGGSISAVGGIDSSTIAVGVIYSGTSCAWCCYSSHLHTKISAYASKATAVAHQTLSFGFLD